MQKLGKQSSQFHLKLLYQLQPHSNYTVAYRPFVVSNLDCLEPLYLVHMKENANEASKKK